MDLSNRGANIGLSSKGFLQGESVKEGLTGTRGRHGGDIGLCVLGMVGRSLKMAKICRVGGGAIEKLIKLLGFDATVGRSNNATFHQALRTSQVLKGCWGM